MLLVFDDSLSDMLHDNADRKLLLDAVDIVALAQREGKHLLYGIFSSVNIFIQRILPVQFLLVMKKTQKRLHSLFFLKER